MIHKTENNMALVGPSGSGKHLFATHRLVTSLVEGKTAAVFDCGRSYVPLVQALGGTLVTVESGGNAKVERFGSLPLTVFELEDLQEPLSIEAVPHLPVLNSNTFVLVDEAFQMASRLPGFWAWLKNGAGAESQFCGVLQGFEDLEPGELPTGTRHRVVERFSLGEPGTLATGQLFQHQDGGIYQFLALARHTDDQVEYVIYEHVWPFESGQVWARPAYEWESRFTPITRAALREAQKQDRMDAQKAVSSAKTARRAAASAAKGVREDLLDAHRPADVADGGLAQQADDHRFNPLEGGLPPPAAHLARFAGGVTCVNRKGELLQLDPFKPYVEPTADLASKPAE
ncbi:DUF1653 domain-containing protein [Burkholderia sp. Bp9125]|nr:DUF1653 domain-containing protein [Burkholderia sp. Bp9125]